MARLTWCILLTHASAQVRQDSAQGGFWKLIDFGLSKRIGEENAAKSHVSTRTIIGTPGYIATEFLQFGHMSPACDVFSLGVTMLAVLTGVLSCPSSGCAWVDTSRFGYARHHLLDLDVCA